MVLIILNLFLKFEELLFTKFKYYKMLGRGFVPSEVCSLDFLTSDWVALKKTANKNMPHLKQNKLLSKYCPDLMHTKN